MAAGSQHRRSGNARGRCRARATAHSGRLTEMFTRRDARASLRCGPPDEDISSRRTPTSAWASVGRAVPVRRPSSPLAPVMARTPSEGPTSASTRHDLLEDPEEPVGAVGEAEEGCERLAERNPATKAAAGKDQPDHALGMTQRVELEDRSTSGREPDRLGQCPPTGDQNDGIRTN